MLIYIWNHSPVCFILCFNRVKSEVLQELLGFTNIAKADVTLFAFITIHLACLNYP